MPLYKNTNEMFGDEGPFVAASREDIVEDLRPTLETWAAEWAANGEQYEVMLQTLADELRFSLVEVEVDAERDPKTRRRVDH